MTSDRVIKASDLAGVQRLFGERRDLILDEQGHRVLLDAEALRAEAKADAEAIRRQAFEDGLAAGLGRVSALIDAIARERAALLERGRDDLARLSVAVARKLLGRALDEWPELSVELVARSLRELGSARRVTLRVAPNSVAGVEAALQRLAAQASEGVQLTVEADDALAEGDVILDSELGRIDARLDVQYERIVAALTEGRD
jgi:flagellar biosynthesis/type III secretory pathway protein FliH